MQLQQIENIDTPLNCRLFVMFEIKTNFLDCFLYFNMTLQPRKCVLFPFIVHSICDVAQYIGFEVYVAIEASNPHSRGSIIAQLQASLYSAKLWSAKEIKFSPTSVVCQRNDSTSYESILQTVVERCDRAKRRSH